MKKNSSYISILVLTLSLLLSAGTAQRSYAEETDYSVSETPAPDESETTVERQKTDLLTLYGNEQATTIVSVKGYTWAEKKTMFYKKKIPNDVWKSMKGKSYSKGCPVKRSGLRLLRILYYGYDKKTHIGEMVVNKKIASKCVKIFYLLYKKKYQIEKVQRIDAYNGDDEASMSDNNTSCFNYRTVSGTTKLSKHSYGLAIDINPRYNPYIRTVNGKRKVEPSNGKKYANRNKTFKHKITRKDTCYKLFHKNEFKWGGDWITVKDYQHFEKI